MQKLYGITKIIYINIDRFIVTRSRFEFLNIIGKGGFGKVWKVIDKKYRKQCYSM